MVVIFYLLLIFTSSSVLANQAMFAIESSPVRGTMQSFKGSELCRVADNTLGYIKAQSSPEDRPVGKAIEQALPGIDIKRVEETLAFICETYISDVRAGRQSRLHDIDFINQNFEFMRWTPAQDQIQAHIQKSQNPKQKNLLSRIPQDNILLTKYYTRLVKGAIHPSQEYSQALYALPYDEKLLTLQQAEQQKELLTRYRYTRQQIMDGVLLEKQLAKPLIWVSEEGLHDVLMQGTAILKLNGKRHFLNVHRNNDIKYDYTQAKDQQKRYWYFKHVPGIMGFGKDAEHKIQVIPQVTFAGDIQNLGLGKLIMLSYRQDQAVVNRLGVLADTGGAFSDNLFQLDLLTDSYYGWQDYYAANKHLPDFVEARILLKKQTPEQPTQN